ncbi:MAG: transporter substrate-binding domain-containing protein, partial [Ilumatobacteraceae bacterium]
MTRIRARGLRGAAASLAALSLIVAACGGSDDSSDDASDDASTEESASDDSGSSDSGSSDSGSSDSDSGDSGSSDSDSVEVTQEGGILAAVKARGTLNCGVSGAAVAFSYTQADGSMEGIDADYCRAVAAAVLGDAEAVEFTSLTAAERFTAVQTGAVDVLMRNSTWTQSRDTEVGMDFGPTTYYDGQQLMARSADGFTG